MRRSTTRTGVVIALATCAAFARAPVALAGPTTFSGVGGTNTSGAALSALNAFEAAIGGANNGAGGPRLGGFRTINWDGVPEAGPHPAFALTGS